MSEATLPPGQGRLRQILDFARSAEPRTPVSTRAALTDALLAAAVLAGSLVAVRFHFPGALAAIVTSVPLAMRRRVPLTAFLTVLLGMLLTRDYATDFSFLALIFAAYSAVVHSRYRGAALLSMAPAGLLIAVTFWDTASALRAGRGTLIPSGSVARLVFRPAPPQPHAPGQVAGLMFPPGTPWRLAVLLVLVSLVSIAVAGTAVHAGIWIRRIKSEHEAATQRALALERARIASELHDVVTHNVSVMIVQAGAARQVLSAEPDEARAALLAVEASGRAAMAELRNLLGLLNPSAEELRPQPGLAGLQALIDGVRSAGLPVDLRVGSLPEGLPAGVDLAAFRVVQEALTNVIKHAGNPQTRVTLECREGALVVEVTDDGAPIPAAVPAAVAAVPGGQRGLLGLRERTALYGGEFTARPRPGGGWRVLARIPVDVDLPPSATTVSVASGPVAVALASGAVASAGAAFVGAASAGQQAG